MRCRYVQSRNQVRQRALNRKRHRKTQKQRTAKQLLFEALETRMVLASDFLFDAATEQREGFNLTLVSSATDLQLIDTQTGAR